MLDLTYEFWANPNILLLHNSLGANEDWLKMSFLGRHPEMSLRTSVLGKPCLDQNKVISFPNQCLQTTWHHSNLASSFLSGSESWFLGLQRIHCSETCNACMVRAGPSMCSCQRQGDDKWERVSPSTKLPGGTMQRGIISPKNWKEGSNSASSFCPRKKRRAAYHSDRFQASCQGPLWFT